MGLRSRAGLLGVYLCWFSLLCTWHFFVVGLTRILIFIFFILSTRVAHFLTFTLTAEHNHYGRKRSSVGVWMGFWEGNFIPVSYTCIPFQQLSPCFAPHSVLPSVACSKWAKRRTHTHTHWEPPITGGEGVSSSTSSVILHRRKSFRFLSCLADRWLHMVTTKWKVRGNARVFYFVFFFCRLFA